MHDDRLLPLLEADRRRLVRAATRLLGPFDAEDAVQDAYVRALEAAPVSELQAAQAWLLTVVRNLAIDRLRRRQWMQQWLAETGDAHRAVEPAPACAQETAALAQEVVHALKHLAIHLTPAEGAAVLLHEVFEASHAEIALASGKTDAASRQQLRRALQRLRQPRDTPPPELDAAEESVLRTYLQALQLREPHGLWAMLQQPPTRAAAGSKPAAQGLPGTRHRAHATSARTSATTTSKLVQIGGQYGLVLTLNGVLLCVLPLGVRPDCEPETALA